MGIVAGKFYNCEWIVGDIYKVALNVGQKSVEVWQDEKQPKVFIQLLIRGSRGKGKRQQKYLH